MATGIKNASIRPTIISVIVGIVRRLCVISEKTLKFEIRLKFSTYIRKHRSQTNILKQTSHRCDDCCMQTNLFQTRESTSQSLAYLVSESRLQSNEYAHATSGSSTNLREGILEMHHSRHLGTSPRGSPSSQNFKIRGANHLQAIKFDTQQPKIHSL